MVSKVAGIRPPITTVASGLCNLCPCAGGQSHRHKAKGCDQRGHDHRPKLFLSAPEGCLQGDSFASQLRHVGDQHHAVHHRNAK